jgi:hypothetical protein
MTYALPFAAGIVLALANIALTRRLPAKKAAEFYNLFMAATAAVYVGSALASGNTKSSPRASRTFLPEPGRESLTG